MTENSQRNKGISLVGIAVAFGMLVGITEGVKYIGSSYIKKPELKTENVIGEEAPEKFCEVNGQRFYLEVDGKPISEYVWQGE